MDRSVSPGEGLYCSVYYLMYATLKAMPAGSIEPEAASMDLKIEPGAEPFWQNLTIPSWRQTPASTDKTRIRNPADAASEPVAAEPHPIHIRILTVREFLL